MHLLTMHERRLYLLMIGPGLQDSSKRHLARVLHRILEFAFTDRELASVPFAKSLPYSHGERCCVALMMAETCSGAT